MQISPLWLAILSAPLNCGKITFLFTLEKATLQQNAFCVLEFVKTSATVTVQRAFGAEFGVDPPHPESIQRWVRKLKESRCVCEGKSPGRPHVLEEQVERIHGAFEKSTVSLHVEQAVSLRSHKTLSGVCLKDDYT